MHSRVVMHSKVAVPCKVAVPWSGPLEPFAAGFDAELARLGYTPAGTRRKLEAVAHLSHWLAGRGMSEVPRPRAFRVHKNLGPWPG